MEARPIKVLVAKPGLDGHDRGAKVVAQALKEAGMEVIYSGLHRTVEQIVQIAIQEDVDVVGLSILSGSHLTYTEKLLKRLAEEGMGEVLIVVGGVIPPRDVPALQAMGIEGIFPASTLLQAIVDFIRSHARSRHCA